MPTPTSRKDLNLKSLELFQLCATLGSLRAAAKETGLSVGTVSHHLRNLEEHLGVELFNHARKPMVLTPKGQAFLRRIDDVLLSLRKAKAEASGGAQDTGYLRIGAIEDFESDVTPDLAVHLSRQMVQCDFSFKTASSHAIIDDLRNHRLDIGITTEPTTRSKDLEVRPLIKDPFVIVIKAGMDTGFLNDTTRQDSLPFLQFSSDLMIGSQIETQLRRLRVPRTRRFECDNTQTLMAMVADGAGWTITTPLMYSRAKRFQDRVQLHPFPDADAFRTVSLVSTVNCATPVVDMIEARLQQSIHQNSIAPTQTAMGWLKDQFHLMAGQN